MNQPDANRPDLHAFYKVISPYLLEIGICAFEEVLELLYIFNVSELETIISKTFGVMRIFLT